MAGCTCLGLFAKYWQPGRVKTRLAAEIGAERAAAVYREFVAALVGRLAQCGEQCYVVFDPAEREAEFRELAPAAWQLEPQAAGDLGQRMRHFFEKRFAEGDSRVVVVGSDSPSMPVDYIGQALDALDRVDVVLGPSEDGGYWLVGARKRVPPIFDDMPWSTAKLYRATCERLDAERIAYAVVSTWYDVDSVVELRRLCRELVEESGLDPFLAQLFQRLSDT